MNRTCTALQTFDEVIRLTQSGSSSNVDMLVGDIYGGDCDAIGLKGDVIAASFGKVGEGVGLGRCASSFQMLITEKAARST